jgi:hypothetical protein
MNPLSIHLPPKTEAELQSLIEPLASYIAAVNRPRVVLIAALLLLLENLREIDEAATAQIASFSENQIG